MAQSWVKRMSGWEWVWLTAVVLFAAILRLGWPGLTEFKADEARLIALAWEMAEGQSFPLRGISSSVGLPNFAVNVWLYALPLMIWPHVYAPTLFTGLLNTAVLPLTYFFTRRYWTHTAALTATFLLAVSPWAIMHSRKIWAQNLLPFFVLLWAISLALALIEGRQKWLAVAVLSAALAFQIHLAAVALFPVSVLLLLLFWRRVAWRWLGVGVGLSLLTAVPFFYYLATQANLDAASLGTAAGSRAGGGLSLDAIWHTIRLHTGWQIHALTGPTAYQAYLALLPPWVMSLARWLWGLLMLGGVLLMAWAWLEGRWQGQRPGGGSSFYPAGSGRARQEANLLVLIWLGGTWLTFLWFPTPVELHYLLPTYPTLFIAAGVSTAVLLPKLGWRLVLLLGMSGAAQVWGVLVLLTFVGQQATPGGFGVPLERQLQAVNTAVSLYSRTSASEILIAGPGDDPELDEFAAVYGVLLRDVPHRYVNIDNEAVFPQTTAVVFAHQAPAPLLDLYRTAASEEQVIPLRLGEGELTILALPAATAPPPAISFDPVHLLVNWVNFLGHDPLQPTGEWRYHWRVGDATPERFHFFNHVQDALGQRIAQTDKPAFRADQWRPGDVVISRFVFQDIEKGLRPLTIRTGMYRYPSLENVPLLDVAANPDSDAAEVIIPLER